MFFASMLIGKHSVATRREDIHVAAECRRAEQEDRQPYDHVPRRVVVCTGTEIHILETIDVLVVV